MRSGDTKRAETHGHSNVYPEASADLMSGADLIVNDGNQLNSLNRNSVIRFLVAPVIVAGSLAISASAVADTIFGLHASAHRWQPDLRGTIGQSGTAFNFSTEFDGDDQADSTSFLLAIEHPIPLIPNVQLRATPLTWTGSSDSASGSLGGIINFTSGRVDAEFDLTSLDGTLYYEILDNWVTLDLGITGRQLDGFIEATEISGLTDRIDIDQIIPMVYGHARFDLPFTGLAAGVRGNAIGWEDNKLSDLEAYLHLEVDLIPLLDIGVQGGFRRLALDVADIDNWQSDATLEGAYIALTGHF